MEFLSMEYLREVAMQHWMLLSLTTILVVLYNHYTKSYNHWKNLGVPFIKPKFIVGNAGAHLFMRKSFHDWDVDLYRHFDGEPFAGLYQGGVPTLMVRDPELIKAVMVRDFDHFVDRPRLHENSTKERQKSLLNLKGKDWKTLRAILTPTFTSGKLKGMQNLVQQCGRQMVEFLKNRPAGETDMEMKSFSGRYSLEVIGSCGFGLDCSSLKDPDAEFIKIAEKFDKPPFYKKVLFISIVLFCPSMLKYFPLERNNRDSLKKLNQVLLKTISQRETDVTSRRNDFLQILLDTSKAEMKENKTNVLDDLSVQAQSMLFLLAGFETSSTLLSFVCLVLSMRLEIQDRLRNDIMKNVEKYGKDCTYDSVKEIPYLEQVLLETLRLYPPVPRVDRLCTKPYVIPGSTVKINPGEVVMIPIAGIYQDPQHYPEPEVFNPERFSTLNNNVRSNERFLAFGLGPRNCIGIRFAMMTTKFFLFYLLQNFKLSLSPKTSLPIKFDRSSIFLKVDGGTWVTIESLNKK